VLWVACGAHALHHGLTDTLYLLLPLWQAQFALSYAAIGLLRALYTGVMAGFQVPAAKLAQRRGGARILAGGTAVAAVAYLLLGAVGAGSSARRITLAEIAWRHDNYRFSTANGRADHPDPGRTRVLWVACGAHALHDGLTDTLYLLLPLWQVMIAAGERRPCFAHGRAHPGNERGAGSAQQ
jgi:MFS family permease